MALAIRTGVPHTVWLDDPAAMAAAFELIRRADQEARDR